MRQRAELAGVHLEACRWARRGRRAPGRRAAERRRGSRCSARGAWDASRRRRTDAAPPGRRGPRRRAARPTRPARGCARPARRRGGARRRRSRPAPPTGRRAPPTHAPPRRGLPHDRRAPKGRAAPRCRARARRPIPGLPAWHGRRTSYGLRTRCRRGTPADRRRGVARPTPAACRSRNSSRPTGRPAASEASLSSSRDGKRGRPVAASVRGVSRTSRSRAASQAKANSSRVSSARCSARGSRTCSALATRWRSASPRIGSGRPRAGKPPSARPVNTTVLKLRPRISSGVSTATPSRPTRPLGTAALASSSRTVAAASATSTSSSITARPRRPPAASRTASHAGDSNIASRTVARASAQALQEARGGRPPQARASAPAAASRPRAAPRRRRTAAILSSVSSSSPSGSGARDLRSASRFSRPRRRRPSRSVHCSRPLTTPACRASSSHNAISTGDALVRRSGAAVIRSMTARRANGSPASGARQSARRRSSRGPGERSGRRQADRQAGGHEGGGDALGVVAVGHDDRAVPQRSAAFGGGDDGAQGLAGLGALVGHRGDGEGRVAGERQKCGWRCNGRCGYSRRAITPHCGDPVEVGTRVRGRQPLLRQAGRARRTERGIVQSGRLARQGLQQVGAGGEQGGGELLLYLVQVVDAVEDRLAERRAAGHRPRRRRKDPGAVEQAARIELAAVGAVETVEVGGLGASPVVGGACRRRDRLGPRRIRPDARLAQVGERRSQRLGEVGQLAGGPEVLEPVGVLSDEAPQKALAGKGCERGRRRPRRLGGQVAGQPREGHDGDVGQRPEPAHEKVADVRAHGRRAHDDRDRRQRPAFPQLEDALYERVLELREAAAGVQAHVWFRSPGHDRGERITQAGRSRPLRSVRTRAIRRPAAAYRSLRTNEKLVTA